MGVERVFITLGDEGVYYLDRQGGEIYMKSAKVSIINATGAGDAFMAGLAYSYLNELDIESTLKFSIGASIITLENENTINPNISVENIEKKE